MRTASRSWLSVHELFKWSLKTNPSRGKQTGISWLSPLRVLYAEADTETGRHKQGAEAKAELGRKQEVRHHTCKLHYLTAIRTWALGVSSNATQALPAKTRTHPAEWPTQSQPTHQTHLHTHINTHTHTNTRTHTHTLTHTNIMHARTHTHTEGERERDNHAHTHKRTQTDSYPPPLTFSATVMYALTHQPTLTPYLSGIAAVRAAPHVIARQFDFLK